MLTNHPKCNLNEKDVDGHTSLHLGEYLNIFELIIYLFIYFI